MECLNLLLWPKQVAQDDIFYIAACVACSNTIPARNSAQGHIQLAMCEWVGFKNQTDLLQRLSLRLVHAEAIRWYIRVLPPQNCKRKTGRLRCDGEHTFGKYFAAACRLAGQNEELRNVPPDPY